MIITLMKTFIIFTTSIFFLDLNHNKLVAKTMTFEISKPKVFKRNKGSCKRLGNIYDACHWMARFVVTNKGNRKITNFCTIMKVDKRPLNCAMVKIKKIKISSNEKKTFLINLTSLFQVPIDAEKPIVRIISK